MEFKWSIDLGQLIVSAGILLVAVIIWFVKKEINSFAFRLDKHDTIIQQLVGDVQKLIGMNIAWDKRMDRRK